MSNIYNQCKVISDLNHQYTWITVPLSETDNFIQPTGAFKLKRLLWNYFETLSYGFLVNNSNLFTHQVDYDNAFAPAELSETVIVEPPKHFEPNPGKIQFRNFIWTQVSSKDLL